MQIIGITGNSGSGKSSIAKIIEHNYGAQLIDADKVARRLLETKTEYYNKIVETFGNNILSDNGNICRQKLAEIIYNNKTKLEKLNRITNKYVVKEIKEEISNSNSELIIIDVPLLFESDLDKNCDIVIAAISKLENKISRICKRDNISKDIAIQRLSIQQEDNFYKTRTPYIIENNKDKECLIKEIKNVFELGGIRTSM